MIRTAIKLWRCERAATSAEFTLVAPALLWMLFGVIDVGRFMWEVNQAEKATQVGARFAVVTTPVSSGLVEADFADADTPAGELIPADAFGELTCTSATCTCTKSPCNGAEGGVNSTAFTNLVTRMQDIYPKLTAAKVKVIYRGSGFGFAGAAVSGGAADTMEISPLVTVSLNDLGFTAATLLWLKDIKMPAASTTLPAEDASGAVSN
jgi:Flp pilus assembly protein TadG